MKLEEKLWVELYRPKKLDECFLPYRTKKDLRILLEKDILPNMLFSGPPGIGKTATARAILEELGVEYIVINGSLDGNVDTLRNDIQQFASTISFNGKKKYVIVDEADFLSQKMQAGLRGFIEQYSKNCGYIFTCNYKDKIMDAIQDSRLSEVQFLFKGDEKKDLAKAVYSKLIEIFKLENVEYDPKHVQKFIVDHLSKSNDLRKLFIKAQRFSLNGSFAEGFETDEYTARFDALVDILKAQDFSGMRRWVGENSDIDAPTIYRYLYDNAKTIINPTLEPLLVILIAKYQFQQAFVADSEINIVACMTEIMTDCFK